MSKVDYNKWRKFIVNETLDEISYDALKQVQDFIDPDKLKLYLPFDNLFKGKMRIVIPLWQESPLKETMSKIIEFFKKNGWEVDLSTGLVSRKERRIVPAGPKKGERIEKVRKERLGKLIKNIALVAKQVDANVPDEEKPKNWKALNDKIKKDFPESKYNGSTYWDWVKLIGVKAGVMEPVAYQWEKFWNQNSEIFRKDPDAMSAKQESDKYAIVISRSPIDVLRMSDWADLESCHTEGHEEWQCAIDEAKGHGPIAYLVLKDDIQYYDLEADEFFGDRDRGVRGITPLTRVRLKRYVNRADGTELAIPERRLYGNRNILGFLDSVTKWARENQPESAEYNKDDMLRLIRTGGHYLDTVPYTLFQNFFDKEPDRYKVDSGYMEDYKGPVEKKHAEGVKKMIEDFNKQLPPNIKFEFFNSARTGRKLLAAFITMSNDWLLKAMPRWDYSYWAKDYKQNNRKITRAFNDDRLIDADYLLPMYLSAVYIEPKETRLKLPEPDGILWYQLTEKDLKDWATDLIEIYRDELPKIMPKVIEHVSEIDRVGGFGEYFPRISDEA